MVRVADQANIYGLAETIAHEIGAHVRGSILHVWNRHDEYGTFVQGSGTAGSLAKKILDELDAQRKKAAATHRVRPERPLEHF